MRNQLMVVNKKMASKKFTIPEQRFVDFIRTVQMPITENSIKRYWIKHISKNLGQGKWVDEYNYKTKTWEFKWVPLTSAEKQRYANAWFDRWLGKFIRLNIISIQSFLN